MSSSSTVTQFLHIELQQDVVLSATAASSGLHHTLEHIPGSALLGVAAKAYDKVGTLAWSVFHAGGVRFGNGLPLRQNEVFVPRPATLETRKSDQKGGFVSVSRHYLRPQLRYRRRTAIDPDTGRAREAALFGYTSLRAGQSFVSRLAIAPDCVAAQDTVLEALTGDPVFVGRSRGTEYGQVRISCLDAAPAFPGHGGLASGSIRFLAVSDCAFPGGGFPDVAILGLPEGWHAVPQGSAIAWRRYAPFNFHRRSFDPERVVLAQGSVLAFDGPPMGAAEQQRVRERLDAGVGLFIAEGLGVILAEPALLAGTFKDVPLAAPEQGIAAPADALFHWLSRRHADWRLGSLVREQAQAYEGEFKVLYRALWREGALTGRSHGEAGPSRAQWGSVRAEAARAASHEVLLHRLFDVSNGVCASGTGGVPWQYEAPALRLRNAPGTAAALLLDAMALSRLEPVLDHEQQPTALAGELARRIVADLAVQMPRVIDELERGTP